MWREGLVRGRWAKNLYRSPPDGRYPW